MGWLAAVSAGLQVFGAIQGAAAQRQQAKASAQTAQYQAAVSRNNAIIAQRNAQSAAQAGNAAIEQKQRETRAKVGAIKAEQAANGVDLNYGSAVDVRSSAAETGQLSAIDLRTQAVRKAYGYQQEASDFETQAGLYETQAKNDITAGNTAAMGTLLGGFSSAGTGYANYLNSKSTV